MRTFKQLAKSIKALLVRKEPKSIKAALINTCIILKVYLYLYYQNETKNIKNYVRIS